MATKSEVKQYRPSWVLSFLAILIVEIGLLYKYISSEDNSNQTDLLIIICIITILQFLLPKIEDLIFVAISKKGFEAKLEGLQEKTSENTEAIVELIMGSMGKDTFFNLEKIASGSFGHFEKEHHMGLETELYYLRNLGYIKLKNANSIYEIKEKGEELSGFIEITSQGKKYIELRRKLNG